MIASILDLLNEPIDALIDYSPPGRAPRNYVPGVLEALAASRGGNAVLPAYEPTKREWIGGLDFVSREEFEAVKAMAAAARDENEALKTRIAALEAGAAKPAKKTGPGA